MSHNHLDVGVLTAHTWEKPSAHRPHGRQEMNQVLESDCKPAFFSGEAEIQMADTYVFHTKYSLRQVSGIQVSFGIFNRNLVMFNVIFLFQWILNYGTISTGEIRRDPTKNRLHCEARVFTKDVWIHNSSHWKELTGASHLGKGCNHWAGGWNSRSNIIYCRLHSKGGFRVVIPNWNDRPVLWWDWIESHCPTCSPLFTGYLKY